MIGRYRRRIKAVEVIEWTGTNTAEVFAFGDKYGLPMSQQGTRIVLTDDAYAIPGDRIVQNGEVWSPNLFAVNYEEVIG